MKSEQVLRSLPFVVMAAVTLIDVLAGPRLGFLPLLTLGPTFASVSGSIRRTALVGVIALALCIPLASYNRLLLTTQNNLTIATIIAITAASMLAGHLRLRREQELADVTAIIAEAADGEISLLNCGHPPPLLIDRDGRARPVEPREEGLPLGLASLGPPLPKPQRVPFGEGEQILFYTDGVIEARDAAGTFYPLPDRAHLLAVADPQSALDELRADLLEHIGGPLLDDAAMLLVRRQSS